MVLCVDEEDDTIYFREVISPEAAGYSADRDVSARAGTGMWGMVLKIKGLPGEWMRTLLMATKVESCEPYVSDRELLGRWKRLNRGRVGAYPEPPFGCTHLGEE
jgi:hypothetical protein